MDTIDIQKEQLVLLGVIADNLQAIRYSIEQLTVKASPTGVKIANKKPANERDDNLALLITNAADFIYRAKDYAGDQKFAAILNSGYMPHGKLLKLMKLPGYKLKQLVAIMLNHGMIERAVGDCYKLSSVAQAAVQGSLYDIESLAKMAKAVEKSKRDADMLASGVLSDSQI